MRYSFCKFRRVILLILLFFLPKPIWAQINLPEKEETYSLTDPPLWLKKLFENLENTEDLKMAKLNASFQNEELQVAESNLYPSLNLTGSASKSKNQEIPSSNVSSSSSSTGNSNSTDLGVQTSVPTTSTQTSTNTDGTTAQLGLNYTLFSQFAISENIMKSKNSVQQSKLQLQQHRLQKQSQLIQILTEWRWLNSVQPLVFSAKKIMAEVQMHSTKKASHLYNPEDWIELEERQAKIELTLVKSEEGRGLVKKALQDLIPQIEVETIIVPNFIIQYDLPTTEELKEIYKKQATSYQISQLQIDSAKRTVRVTEWQKPYIPIVSTSLSQVYSRPYNKDTTSDSWSAQVLLTFNLFDGFSQNSRREQARIAHKFSELKAESEANKKTIFLQHERMNALVSYAEFKEKNVLLKKKNLQQKDIQKKFNQGLASQLDLAVINLDVVKAELESLEALKNYYISLLNIAVELNDLDKVYLKNNLKE